MKITKTVALLTALVFMLTQVLLAGWAVVNTNALNNHTDQDTVLTTPAVGEGAPQPAPVAAAPAAGVTDFLMGGGPTPASSASAPSAQAAGAVLPDTVADSNTPATSPAAQTSGAVSQPEDSSSDTPTQATGTVESDTKLDSTGTHPPSTPVLPVPPPLGVTNTVKPSTLFYSEAQQEATLNEWAGGLAIPNESRGMLGLLADVMTSIRNFASTVWTAVKQAVRSIIFKPLDSGGMTYGDGTVYLNSVFASAFNNDRMGVMHTLLHEAFHNIGRGLDNYLGFLGLGNRHDEGSTDARAWRALEIISTNKMNDRGWQEVTGEEFGPEYDRYHASENVKDEYYTIGENPVTGERIVNRYIMGGIPWHDLRLTGDYMCFSFHKNFNFSGQTEVYRSDNTLARIIKYEKAGVGERPGLNNRIASITYYDMAGTSVTRKEEYVWPLAISRDCFQIITKDPEGVVLSSQWYEQDTRKLGDVPHPIANNWNAPSDITVNSPTSSGQVTLSGTRVPGTSIWYSVDGGLTYKKLVDAIPPVALAGMIPMASPTWSGDIFLPSGTTTISVISRFTAMAAGILTSVASSPVALEPITFIVPVPTVIAAVPDAYGKVNLSGAVTAGHSVYYSFDGQKWMLADSTTSTGQWSKQVTLPAAGTTTIYVRAKIGQAFSESATTTATFSVPAPTLVATTPDANGKVTISGTAVFGQSIQYSYDGVKWLTAGAVSSTGAWSRQITLPAAGTTTIQVRAMKATFFSESVSTSVTFTVPVPTVAAATPNASGKVALSGTVSANQEVQYSFDGQTWLAADNTTANGQWSRLVTLPAAGITTIYVRAKTGNFFSESAAVTVTFTVPEPTLNVATPDANGKVTLSGTAVAGQSIQYSFDGVTWLSAGAFTGSTWTKQITLPATGTTTIYARAQKGNFFSESVSASVTFTVPAPTVTATPLNSRNEVTLSGTVTRNHTVQYSLDGVTWLTVTSSTPSGLWSRLLKLPVGVTSIFVRAKIGNLCSEPVTQAIA